MHVNADITLYNRVGGSVATFYRTHLRGVYFEDVKSQRINKQGAVTADSMLLLIPAGVNAGGKSFAGQKGFAATEEKTGLWTLAEGDIVVRGIIHDDIAAQSDLEKLYDTVRKITAIIDNRHGSPAVRHWEVSGA